ncbi:MAG: HAMP domain-containing protein [Deltaproteobacteria bacterium]|nr:HAMP domain-containing protein [Deltaproteobacteria bacterium]
MIKGLSLTIKISLGVVVMTLILSAIYTALVLHHSETILTAEFEKRGEALVTNLALNAELGLLIGNKSLIAPLAENLAREGDVIEVRILDNQGDVLLEQKGSFAKAQEPRKNIVRSVTMRPTEGEVTDRINLFFEGDNADRSLIANSPSHGSSRILGTVSVTFSKAEVLDALSRLRLKILYLAASVGVIFGLAAFWVARLMLRPVVRLARATSEIADGHWISSLNVSSQDEVGRLTMSFNRMVDALIMKERELRETYQRLMEKEKMAELGRFSSVIAHELKNSLGIIHGSLGILLKHKADAPLRLTMAEYITDEVKRLNHMVEEFLAFSRPGPKEWKPVDLNFMLDQVASMGFPVTEEGRTIDLNVEGEGEPCLVMGDRGALTQAVVNLMYNAYQAITGDKGRVTIKVFHEDGQATMSFADTGAGLSEELTEKIFDPFFTTKEKGAGLGLALVKKVIDYHHGTIQVAQNYPHGAIFILRLPLANNQEDDQAMEDVQHVTPKPEATVSL